jgi:sulfate adenylyltransferase large subunit
MEAEHLKLVLVGHVDHGKSTLIGRLFFDCDSLPKEKIDEVRSICEALGKELEFSYVLDHLEEERSQGITIDTTQTFFNTDKRHYVIIDAPGHREFTKNMITGASQAEAAILMVDADEGVQEQTRRHAYILSLLGLNQVIVAVNKMDLVNYSQEIFHRISEETRAFLEKISIAPSFLIPISALKGENVASRSKLLNWYKGPTILEALDTFKTSKDRTKSPLRLPVQDVYNIEGKRIIAGRLEGGVIKSDQEILILPSSESTTVNSIEEYQKEDKNYAVAGESTGITIKDKLVVFRGNVICTKEDKPVMTKELKGNLFWMDKKPLKKGDRVSFKCSTQEALCTVKVIQRRMDSSTLEIIENNASKLMNREVGEVLLSFSDFVIVEDFNKTPELRRFIIEKGYDTAGGGIITDLGEESQ